jgi:hypothetical protein
MPTFPFHFPAAHRVQSSALSCAEMVVPSSAREEPAGHPMHVPAPASEYVPTVQTWQSSALSWAVMVAPSSARCVPAGQAWQSSTLSWAEMVAPSSARYLPAGQMEHAFAPADEYDPAGHTWQSPLLSVKVPAWQSSQSSMLSCAVMVAPSSPMAVPAGHFWQSSRLSWASAVVPSSVRYELAGQIVHVPAPGDEYEPAAHITQSSL